MRLRLLVLGYFGLLGSGFAATLNNSSLNGKFFFVQLLVTSANGQATNAQNASGAITFDGKGGYTFSGNTASGSGSPAAATSTGTYAVASAGSVSLTNPIQKTVNINTQMSGDANVLVGATTEASTATNDVFVAIRAPSSNVANTVLNGTYKGSSLQLPNGQSTAVKSSVISMTTSGNGQFSNATIVGHSADQSSGLNVSQQATGATYNLNSDGTGSANFGSAASLFSGTRELFVSQDGNYILGDSTAGGIREIFVAIKGFGSGATAATFGGRYWVAELDLDPGRSASCSSFSFEGASGAMQALGDGRVLFAERLHIDASSWDYSFINYYSVNSDGTGSLTPLAAVVNNMALGVPVTVSGKQVPNTVVGSQIGVVNQASCLYGFVFGVLAPDTSAGTGVYINPAGVVNNASFAPYPSPVSPGTITALFGSGLASSAVSASTLPLPTNLGNVSVLVNGTAAPLFFVSSGQINFQMPFGVTGSTVTIQVTNNGAQSNQVTIPLSATSPGIFQFSDADSKNHGVVLHANFKLVTSASPASPGETVIIYLSGLGALSPAVPSGAANPTTPLSSAADPNIFIAFGGEVATAVPFIGGAPTYAGLNQINVTIPTTTVSGSNVPVAIITSNGVTDIVDIPIGL